MTRHRRSVFGKRLAVFAAIVLVSMDLPQGFLIEPLVHADDGQNRAQSSQLQSLDPFFKGKLPITELTEDEAVRSEEHTSELQSHLNLVCRLLLEKKNKSKYDISQRDLLGCVLRTDV